MFLSFHSSVQCSSLSTLLPNVPLFPLFCPMFLSFHSSAQCSSLSTLLSNAPLFPPVDSVRGSCAVDGESYKSETAVPRDHPCHYCICYQGQVRGFLTRASEIMNEMLGIGLSERIFWYFTVM